MRGRYSVLAECSQNFRYYEKYYYILCIYVGVELFNVLNMATVTKAIKTVLILAIALLVSVLFLSYLDGTE